MKSYDSIVKGIKVDSLLVTVVLMSTTISQTLSLGFGISSGANAYVLFLLFLIFAYKLVFIREPENRYKMNGLSVLLLVMISILYVVTKTTKGDESPYTFIQLLFYAILPLICINLKFNIEYVLRYAVYISLITILAGNEWFEYQYKFMNQADMGRIYPIVTALIASLFHFRYYRKGASGLIKIGYLYNAYMFVRVIMVANRGAALSLLCCIFVLFLYAFNNDGTMESMPVKPMILLSIATIGVFVVVNNLSDVLTWLEEMCDKLFNYVPSVIIKMQNYLEMDDLLNGREGINETLFEAIGKSPIYGHGMVTFASYTNNEYPFPHNFVLQYLFEGGILFAALPVFLATRILVCVLLGRIKTKSEYVMAAMLTCQCIPKLLLSSDAWYGTAVWMMIAFSGMQMSGVLYKESIRKYR